MTVFCSIWKKTKIHLYRCGRTSLLLPCHLTTLTTSKHIFILTIFFFNLISKVQEKEESFKINISGRDKGGNLKGKSKFRRKILEHFYKNCSSYIHHQNNIFFRKKKFIVRYPEYLTTCFIHCQSDSKYEKFPITWYITCIKWGFIWFVTSMFINAN